LVSELATASMQFAAHIKSEIARFGRIAKAAGIKAE
jgi:tripartite-type tricarboxylate transporter receptor subunit TctC